jgi:hypothetical protein
MKEFIKTDKIKSLESEIERLENELINQNNLLEEEFQNEFDKQFELVQGKTILICDGKEYVYKGIDHRYSQFLWVEGICLKKDGVISKNTKALYNEWTKTGKEYNDGVDDRVKL